MSKDETPKDDTPKEETSKEETPKKEENLWDIKNIGDTPLITLFWINEFYNENDSDTFFEKV